MDVLLIVPTRNACNHIGRFLDAFVSQSYKCDLCVVDSSSEDGTVEIAREKGAHVHVIPVSQFNHGGTRQKMVFQYPAYDVYIFMTQDAFLFDDHAIENLLAPLSDPLVGAVCGRQVPHFDANLLATHARLFNYPPASLVKSISDAAELGIKAPFISNSFAAYRRKALLEVGGFPNNVILSEDMYVAARMLLNGWKVAYAGDARCRHSHNYTIPEEFRRYFDQGVFHARESWIRAHFGSAGGEGLRYVMSELKFLGISRLHLWPSSLLRNTCKLIGYKLGQKEAHIPVWLKRRLSMHRRFWDRSDA